MPRTKKMRCPFCDNILADPDHLVTHLDRKHSKEIPPNMTIRQYVYFLRTGKDHGRCVCCGNPTDWNETTGKYKRFCNNPACKQKYRDTFKERMIGKYGKTTLLNDPEQQKIMLQNRSISGMYRWRDHVHETPYTGTYERDFLEFLDKVLDFDPDDVMGPSPHTYKYIYDGKEHFYIPDFFIPSLGLEIEVKTHENNHHKIQAVDRIKEEKKDEVMRSIKNTFDYIKIVDKNYTIILDYFMRKKDQVSENEDTKIVIL